MTMGKDNFEKVIRERYQGAEVQPSEGLWSGIEVAIANEEASRYKRGMAYYRWIAAAGLILILGYLGYRGFDARTVKQVAKKIEVDQPVTDNAINGEANNDLPRDNKPNQQYETLAEVGQHSSAEKGSPIVNSAREPVVSGAFNSTSDLKISQETAFKTKQGLPEDIRMKLQTERLSSLTEALLVSKLEDQSLPAIIYGVVVYPIEKTSHKAVMWAGLNMAPGYFDPNYTEQGNQLASANSLGGLNQVSGSEDHKTGFSMAFGVEMGVQLSDRWQISSGLQYLNNNVQSSTDLVLDNRTPVFSSTVESLDLQADESRSNLSFEPTDLDNTFQFVSIPVQAGYLVMDKRIKLMLNAGIASDLFLKNRISSVDNSLESVTINPGSDAPFKSVYFNGLLGAQASYELLPRYLITLEPRYKLALSEFTKSNIAYSSLPSSFGIGVGIKYVFK